MNKFKGYYFKCSSGGQTVALIPAKHGKKASLQIITENNSYNIKYDRIFFGDKIPRVKIGNCIFAETGILLDIDRQNVKAKGILRFDSFTLLKYDIMGVFKLFSPILQCRHRIISMKHNVSGHLLINGEKYIFNNDNCYIEGDEGSAFPRKYIWAHGFFRDNSVMLSIADVPLFGAEIQGIIAAVYANGKEYRLATYLGAKILSIGNGTAEIRQGKYTLTLKRFSDNSQKLFAPKNGEMKRTVQESVRCKLYCCLKQNNAALLEFVTEQGSWESEM